MSRRRRRLPGCAIVAALTLGVLAAVVYVALFALRGRTPRIEGEHAIASLEQVELGGVFQWVLIRGTDRRKPVVLWLHGGPGMPAMYLSHAFQRPLEEDFVVVHWDRSGAGKSYGGIGDAPIGVRRRLDDTIELTRQLQERFGDAPIYLVGHSWGSYLGLLAVRERPDLYAGFVGTGVLAGTREEADSLRRAWLLERAEAAGDDELRERLESGGEPGESDVFRHGGALRGATSFWPILRIGLAAPEYTLVDALNVRRGVSLVHERMQYDVEPRPLEGEVDSVAVPVAFFLGRHDFTTPSDAAAEYLERLRAPWKRLVWFEESAHFPFLSEPLRFHRALAGMHADVSVDPGATLLEETP